MEITVSEGLRLKNEIAKIVSTIVHETKMSPAGTNSEEGVMTSNEADANKFTINVGRLGKALEYSEEINKTLSSFNKETGIDNKVRSMHNHKLLIEVYTHVLPKTKAVKSSRFEIVGNERKQVKVEYTPAITGASVKENIAKHKTFYREYQAEIEKLNARTITLSFSHEDVADLISAE